MTSDTRELPKRMSSKQVGMLTALASFGMLFGTLLLSYGLARARLPAWPPLGVEPVPPLLPLLSLPVMLLSSWKIWEASKRFSLGDRDGFVSSWKAALGLGLLFFALQVGLWIHLARVGLHLDSSLFGSIVYVLTGVHAAHVLGGLGALGWVASKAQRLPATSEAPLLVGWFWHFLDAVWMITVVMIIW